MDDKSGEVLSKSNLSHPLLNSRNNSTRSIDKEREEHGHPNGHIVTEYDANVHRKSDGNVEQITANLYHSTCVRDVDEDWDMDLCLETDQLDQLDVCLTPELEMHYTQDTTFPKSKFTQQPNSILNKLPVNVIQEIFQHVDQYDLVHLLQVCRKFYPLAAERLYKRVTVILNAELPLRYKGDSSLFIKDNGIKFMDTALILSCERLLMFLDVLKNDYHLVQRVKFFVFDKCHSNLKLDNLQISLLQNQIIDFFGTYSHEINFLHITFIDFLLGIEKLTNFLRNENVRNRIFKLFVTNLPDLYQPVVPQGLTNLFLMLDEVELMKYKSIDLNSPPFKLFNSLFTLTCSTNNQFGLEILSKLKLINPDAKLKLKGLTVFHCHKENLLTDDNNLHNEILSHASRSTVTDSTNVDFNDVSNSNADDVSQYMQTLVNQLDFKIIDDKVDLKCLSNLYLKIDCNEHRNNTCHCFPNFFKDLTTYAYGNDGLMNLGSFELELFPNLEWLRPHQLLENILTPLGNFIKSLGNLTRLTIDFSTPGFKMFDNSMGMDSLILNKLSERLMEAFFLCFLSTNGTRTVMNLRTLQLPDFLTSFIYYKPDFYESLLHTCKCWGCQLVLDRLKELFYPLSDDEDEEDEDEGLNATRNHEMDLQSTYYILIGFILGKLQADREVCVPIKQRTFNYRNYPIYKGQPHTLHNHFHKHYTKKSCKCQVESDPEGHDEMNIDNLVTTYVIHQLKPITSYLSMIFFKLENLMIHGIYYEFVGDELVPIYDQHEYPKQLLASKTTEIQRGEEPNLPFGEFRKR